MRGLLMERRVYCETNWCEVYWWNAGSTARRADARSTDGVPGLLRDELMRGLLMECWVYCGLNQPMVSKRCLKWCSGRCLVGKTALATVWSANGALHLPNETIWTGEPEWTRTTLKDIIDDKPGPTAKCLNSESPIDCFNLFLDQEMRNIVINYSNLNEERRIGGLIKGNKKTRGFEPLNQLEFDTFVGICIALGALNQNSVDIHWIWSKKHTEFHFSFVRKAMTLTKFKRIRSMLRFDDKLTRDQRKKSDKLAAIREFNDKLQANCIHNYNPEENLTIDERISPFHGRVGFKIFMKSKPHKYGLKIWMLCGATVRYVHNFQVYTGMIDGKREENQTWFSILNLDIM